MPPAYEAQNFSNAKEAVKALRELYDRNTGFLRERFEALTAQGEIEGRVRAFYPQISIETDSYAQVDSRLAFGHLPSPGAYAITITRPDLFANYLESQISLVIESHKISVRVSESTTPIPLHFRVSRRHACRCCGSQRDGQAIARLFRCARSDDYQ